jgi:hypothetical protein
MLCRCCMRGISTNPKYWSWSLTNHSINNCCCKQDVSDSPESRLWERRNAVHIQHSSCPTVCNGILTHSDNILGSGQSGRAEKWWGGEGGKVERCGGLTGHAGSWGKRSMRAKKSCKGVFQCFVRFPCKFNPHVTYLSCRVLLDLELCSKSSDSLSEKTTLWMTC